MALYCNLFLNSLGDNKNINLQKNINYLIFTHDVFNHNPNQNKQELTS